MSISLAKFYKLVISISFCNKSYLHQIIFFDLKSKNFITDNRSFLALCILLKPFTWYTWCACFFWTINAITLFLAFNICKNTM